MINIKEITQMCRSGKTAEAYDSVKAALRQMPDDVWLQRAMGWVLYYRLKPTVAAIIPGTTVAEDKVREAVAILKEFCQLRQLIPAGDSMVWNCLLWELRRLVSVTPKSDYATLDAVMDALQPYTFPASEAYSALLGAFKRHDGWPRLIDFYDWWNLGSLLPADYQPIALAGGKHGMSLAEQVYISYAKLVIARHDKDRIQAFLPLISHLAEAHPEMVYPGYFQGRLMMATGDARAEVLTAVVPFVRKKKNEFWAWQLVSEVYRDDPKMRLACLLRATHCRTDEKFLGKIRTQLALLFWERGDYGRTRYQIERVIATCQREQRRPSFEIISLSKEPALSQVAPDATDAVDYKSLTDAVLTHDIPEQMAVVVWRDLKTRRAALVYGRELWATTPLSVLPDGASVGTLLKTKWLAKGGKLGHPVLLQAELATASSLSLEHAAYLKAVEGVYLRKPDAPFAFVRAAALSYYVAPPLVKQHESLDHKARVAVIAVYAYSRRRAQWSWQVVSLRAL